MSKIELKPCLFCGSKAEIYTTYDTEWIECMACHSRSPVYVGDYYDEGFMDGRFAAQMWNSENQFLGDEDENSNEISRK